VILDYLNHHPDLGLGARIASLGAVIGRSRVGARPTLGEYATVRADGENIGIGANAWFGEHSTVHIADQILGAAVGDDATVGRYGVVHACTLGHGVVIGESSVVMDGARVGDYALIAADTVVPPRKDLPGGFLYAGHPAKRMRAIARDELAALAHSLPRQSRAAAQPEVQLLQARLRSRLRAFSDRLHRHHVHHEECGGNCARSDFRCRGREVSELQRELSKMQRPFLPLLSMRPHASQGRTLHRA